MYKDVEQWIKTCIACAQKTRPVDVSEPPLLPIPATEPWDVDAVDCVLSMLLAWAT